MNPDERDELLLRYLDGDLTATEGAMAPLAASLVAAV